jgi:hypothetical protein
MVTQAQFDDAYNNAKNLANASQDDMLQVGNKPHYGLKAFEASSSVC